ncbi:MAG TPA: glucose-6-phosphate isomerase, partial [Marinobacter hydrocarbonoclasticus]|nr:glucose-6-phosphate isomerase [Marinobacter nauticus]
MPEKHPALTSRAEWQALNDAKARLEHLPMRELFQQDPGRAQRYLVEGAGLSLDFSRNRLTDEVLEALLNLARACGLEERRTALFRGGLVNLTEQRPALHTALREGEQGEVRVNGDNVIPEIHRTLGKMEALVESIHSGERTGHSGARFTDVVSIGIGGSFLGPKLAVEALRPYWQGSINCHFVANIDGTDITETLACLNPDTTLFLVQSKSFRTQETLENSLLARQWFLDNGGNAASVSQHFMAVTANVEEAARFGIEPANTFPMWDWVGGRYSLWSAIGLPIAL